MGALIHGWPGPGLVVQVTAGRHRLPSPWFSICIYSCIHPQLRDLLVVANGQVIGASYQHLARYTLPKRRVRVYYCSAYLRRTQHAEWMHL